MKLTPSVRLLVLLSLASCGGGKPQGPNILLITLDTTRADHLGCYGYSRATSPELDRLAQESVVYDNAYAVSSWTMPAHASLFTGKFPSAHGAKYDPEGALKLLDGIDGHPDWDKYRANPIADDEITLAALLAGHGYATGGVVGGPWMKKPFRLDRGFKFYNDDNITELNGRDAEDLTRVAKGFIDRNADQPFFLFLNYYDAHSPFVPRWDHLRGFSDLGPSFQGILNKASKQQQLSEEEARILQNALYDSEIAYADAFMGELFSHLRAKGLWDDTWIIVTSDHGELMGDPLLGESGLWGHGNSLSQAEIHIPMVVKYPAVNGEPGRRGRDETPVQQLDVFPTILQGVGLELPEVSAERIQGNPFDRQNRPVFAEVYPLPMMNSEGKDWRHFGDWRVMFDGKKKYVWSSEGKHYMVDLAADPGETLNVLEVGGAEDEKFERRVMNFLRSLPEPGGVGDVDDLPDDVLKKLKGLGYVDVDD